MTYRGPSGDSPVPVALADDLPVHLRGGGLFDLAGLYISYDLLRLVVLVEDGHVEPGVAGLEFIQFAQAGLGDVVDGAAYFFPPE